MVLLVNVLCNKQFNYEDHAITEADILFNSINSEYFYISLKMFVEHWKKVDYNGDYII